MDTRTGKLVPAKHVEEMTERERKFFVPVKRDLSAKEAADMQLRLYAPCACGSGKKFKFCCKRK